MFKVMIRDGMSPVAREILEATGRSAWLKLLASFMGWRCDPARG